MQQAPIRIIQISDMHLMADPQGALLGVKTQESFQAVLDLIQREENHLDFIILSGDLSQDATPIAYQQLAKMVNVLQTPAYYVPGNHDEPNVLTATFPLGSISNDKHIIKQNWQFILLDSHLPGEVKGFLAKSQLDFLRQCLENNPNHRAIIVFHHQPIPVGAKWLDGSRLTNAEEFWRMVAAYPHVHTVLFGHVHQEVKTIVQGINCYALPSTCIQFKPNQDKFGLEKIPPGYRWIELHADGKINTGIKRVAAYVGLFDENAKGY